MSDCPVWPSPIRHSHWDVVAPIDVVRRTYVSGQGMDPDMRRSGRSHPHQQSKAERCADRRFRGSLPTVSSEVISSEIWYRRGLWPSDRRSDQAGVLAELGRPRRGDGPMAGSREPGLVRFPGRVDQELASLGHTAGLGAHPVPRPALSVGVETGCQDDAHVDAADPCCLRRGKALIRVLIGDAVRRCDLEPVERHQIQVRSWFARSTSSTETTASNRPRMPAASSAACTAAFGPPETTAIGTDPWCAWATAVTRSLDVTSSTSSTKWRIAWDCTASLSSGVGSWSAAASASAAGLRPVPRSVPPRRHGPALGGERSFPRALVGRHRVNQRAVTVEQQC